MRWRLRTSRAFSIPRPLSSRIWPWSTAGLKRLYDPPVPPPHAANPAPSVSADDTRRAGNVLVVWLVAITVTWALVVGALAGERAILVFATIVFEGWLPAVNVAAATLFGVAVVRRLCLPATTSRVFVIAAGTVVGLGTLATLALLLGLAGGLGPVPAWLLVGGLGLAGGIDLGRSSRRDEQWSRPVTLSPAIWLALPAAAAIGVASVAACVPPGIMWGGEPNGYDVVSYHLQIPREWSELGRVVPLEHNVFSYFPLANEALFLLMMEQAGGGHAMLYAPQLLQVLLLGLCGLAAAGVVRELALDHLLPAVVAGVLVICLPWSIMLGSIAYNEVLLLLGGIVAVGSLCIAWTREDMAGRSRLMVLAGLASGLAAATKYTGIPMLLVPAGVAIAAMAAARRDVRGGVVGLVTFSIAAAVFIGPWLIRNIAWAGNPVFPLATGLFGDAGRGEVFVERWETAHAPGGEVGHVLGRFLQEVLVSPNYAYGFLPLAITTGIVVFVLRKSDRRPTLLLGAWLGVMLLVWLLATHLQSRFAFITLAPATILVGLSVATPARWAVTVIATGLSCLGSVVAGDRMLTYLNQPVPGTDVTRFDTVGADSLNFMTSVDTEEQLIYLIGDARAFYYRSDLVHYRIVFDVPPAEGAVQAWLGDALQTAPGDARAVIDSREIERLAGTYGTPPLETVIEKVVPPDPGGRAVLSMSQVRALLNIPERVQAPE